MKIFAAAGLILLFAGQSYAYVSVDCDVDVKVENRISRLDMDQQIGSERIECSEGNVLVVRIVKTAVSVQADAEAKAHARASARYSDSCSCGGGSCSTSGSGSDSCSDSGSDSVTQNKTAETKFVVARASIVSLNLMGFRVRPSIDSCQLTDAEGFPLNALKEVSIVTMIYGGELMKEADPGFGALEKLAAPRQQVLPPAEPGGGLKEAVGFDGEGGN